MSVLRVACLSVLAAETFVEGQLRGSVQDAAAGNPAQHSHDGPHLEVPDEAEAENPRHENEGWEISLSEAENMMDNSTRDYADGEFESGLRAMIYPEVVAVGLHVAGAAASNSVIVGGGIIPSSLKGFVSACKSASKTWSHDDVTVGITLHYDYDCSLNRTGHYISNLRAEAYYHDICAHQSGFTYALCVSTLSLNRFTRKVIPPSTPAVARRSKPNDAVVLYDFIIEEKYYGAGWLPWGTERYEVQVFGDDGTVKIFDLGTETPDPSENTKGIHTLLGSL